MANAHHPPVVVALAPSAPDGMDREAALEWACELIVDAGRAGAHLLVLPALCISDIAAPSAAADRLGRAAHRARIHVVVLPRPPGAVGTMLHLDALGGVLDADRPLGGWPLDNPEPIVYVTIECPGAAGTPAATPAPPPTRAGGI